MKIFQEFPVVEQTQDLDTRMFLPAWWVQAYDAASAVSVEREFGIPEIIGSRIWPVMSAAELNVLASLLSQFQQQMFAHGLDTVGINPTKLYLDAQSFPNNKKVALERVLSCLGGLRVIENASGGVRTRPLFTGESWAEADNDWQLNLKMSQDGADLIFGYGDPYFAMTSVIQSSVDHDQKTAAPPLSLWKSVWLDLQGAEQRILLQLEKCMQWSNEWLHLEGVFETDLDCLFSGLRLPAGRDHASELVRRLKVLEKLGRKLVDHGFLAGALESRFLTFDGESTGGFHLGWQIAKERLFGEEFWRYGLNVARCFAQRDLAPENHGWFRFMANGVAVARIGLMVEQVFPDLIKLIEEIKRSPVLLDGNQLLSFPQLFIEWMIRQHPGHPLPLPKDLRSSEAGQLASPKAKEPLADRFLSFVDEISDHPSYGEALSQVKFATLVSSVTKGCPEFIQWADKMRAGKTESLGNYAYVEEAKPQLIFSRPTDSDLIEAEATDGSRPTMQRTGEAAAKIRKIAMEELVRIKAQAPDKYLDLQKLYFESLDDGERRLIMDVQRRMQTSTFEDHLKPHLIKYMIENPASWGSRGSLVKNIPTTK